MPRKQGWIVTTSQDRPIRDVAKDLTRFGFTVGQILEEVGCITGMAGQDAAGMLQAIPGVLDVSLGVQDGSIACSKP